MTRRARVAVAGVLALTAACARGEPLRLVACETGAPDGARLNQPIVLRFSGAVDPGSVRAASVRVVRERDGAPAAGRLKVDGAVVTFLPRGPCRPDLSDGGFQRGERYRVEVPALPVLACVRAANGGLLDRGGAFPFTVTDAPVDAPAERLFFDADPGVAAQKELAATLRGDRAFVRISRPLDPRSLADAAFRFEGPWSVSSRPTINPLFQAQLVENDREAVIELVVVGPPPMPLEPREKEYQAAFENGKLRDLSGVPQFTTTETARKPTVKLTYVPMDAPDKPDKKDHP